MKILVGYDGSSNSHEAVKAVSDMAKKLDASVTVVNICWEKSLDDSYVMLQNPKRLLEEAGVKVKIKSVRSNNPPQTITRMAENENFDLIVVGSQGMGSLKSFLMGSVSSKIVQDATSNVLVIK